MTAKRYAKLMRDQESRLTAEEIGEGWHFCPEWDDLLIGPGMPELESCLCEPAACPGCGWPLDEGETICGECEERK